MIVVAIILPHFSLELFILIGEIFELDGLLTGLVNFQSEDVVQSLYFLDGVVQFAFSFSVPPVEFADCLLVVVELLLDFELVGIAEVGLQVAVSLLPGLYLVGLIPGESVQLSALLLLCLQSQAQSFELLTQ